MSYYRVRKSWEDLDSQIGAFTVLSNAKMQADMNPGYQVYDDKGTLIYTPAAVQQTSGRKGRYRGRSCDGDDLSE